MLRNFALAFAVSVVVGAGSLAGWISTHSSDLPAVNDSDLEQVVHAVGPDQNGYEALLRASRVAKLTFEDDERVRTLLRGEGSDPAWVAGLMAANREAFAELERAIAAPAIVLPDDPVHSASHATDGFLEPWMLTRLMSLEARLRLRDGHSEAALEASRLGLRLGAALWRADRAWFLSAFYAMNVQRVGLNAFVEVARTGLPDAGASLRLSRELESYRPTPESWKNVWAGEYQFVREVYRRAKPQEVYQAAEAYQAVKPEVELTNTLGLLRFLPNRFVWQPNRTMNATAVQYRGFAAAFSRPCQPAEQAFEPRGDRAARLASVVQENGLGTALLGVAAPNLGWLNARRCHLEARLSLVEALVAVRAFEHETGQAPDSLDALVPRYLDRVPIDAFGGEPLRWDPARGLVSSIGSDFAPSQSPSAPSFDDELEPALYVP